MPLLGEPLLRPAVFLGQRVVRADMQGPRAAAGGKLGHANLVPGEHERARERDTRLGVERRRIAVVVAGEPRTGGGGALRADSTSKLREDLHKEGAELRLRDRPPDRDGALRGQFDDLDWLGAHATGGKSPCSRK